MEATRTLLGSTTPPEKSSKAESSTKSPASVLASPQTERIARSAVSRVGRFLLTKCATKRNPGDSGILDEYFLADDLRRPDETTRAMLAKLDKQIKTKVTEMSLPTPTKLIFIGYKTQQVSGTDYFLKVKATNSGQYFHVRVYESLQMEFILQDVAGPKFNADKIEILN